MSKIFNKECACDRCVQACKTNPGWFAPGEAEKAAEHLGVDFQEFKKTRLIEDYWFEENFTELTVLAPRKVGPEFKDEGERASFSYPFHHGDCTFLKNNRCEIHAVKPMECRLVVVCDESKEDRSERAMVVKLWRKQARE